MERKFNLFLLVCFMAILSLGGCKDEPSQIPTVPTTFGLEDGAVVEDLTVKLSASGSTVEDNGLSVSYVYYIGKSADALEKTSSNVTLEPYTQYFWCVQAKTEAGEGEKTEVRTFYCVPPFNVTTDNGDGVYAAVIKWNNGERFKSVTITATANHEGYKLEPQTVTNGADSCYFERKRDTSDPTKDNVFVQYWDDEHGIYAEPVVYDFTVEATAQVGDKDFTLKSNAKECILDKQHVVRDHEYNVYRVVTHDNQTWLADDLRATSYIDENGEVVKLKEGTDYIYSTLKSGATGVLYRVGLWEEYPNAHTVVYTSGELDDVWKSLDKIQFAPKGYDVPLDEDFLEIERGYGLEDVSVDKRGGLNKYLCIVDSVDAKETPSLWAEAQSYFEGEDTGIMLYMASPYDWENVPEIPGQGWFNAKPFGLGANDSKKAEEATIGKGAYYLTKTKTVFYGQNYYAVRIFSNKHKGVVRGSVWVLSLGYGSLRCIKK